MLQVPADTSDRRPPADRGLGRTCVRPRRPASDRGGPRAPALKLGSPREAPAEGRPTARRAKRRARVTKTAVRHGGSPACASPVLTERDGGQGHGDSDWRPTSGALDGSPPGIPGRGRCPTREPNGLPHGTTYRRAPESAQPRQVPEPWPRRARETRRGLRRDPVRREIPQNTQLCETRPKCPEATDSQ